MSEFPLDAVAFQPVKEQVFRWDFPRVELVDAKTLSCRHDGHEPTILHACAVPKPWESAGVRRNIYLHLLRRLLTAPDVELRVRPSCSNLGYGLVRGESWRVMGFR